MCQSSVYILEDDKERELKKDVVLVEPLENGVMIQGFFESPLTVPARIVKIDLLKHKIILEPLDRR